MNIAQLAIKRPLFIACIIILILVMGLISIDRLGVDLFPPIDFPVVTVTTIYPGATPEEIEKLISKPVEDQVSTIAGIKRLSSRNMEGVSTVIAEFTYETDVKYAEQKMREKVALARNNLPDDLLDEPIVRQFDFTDIPVITIALISELPPTEAYDLAKETIKPMIEQASGVGEVRISGGLKREIRVELDRNKLKAYEFSVIDVVNRLRNYGANISIGKFDKGTKSKLYRTISEFTDINQVKKVSVSFSGDVGGSNTIDKFGTVIDSAEDQKSIAELYYPVEEKAPEPGFFKNLFSKQDKKPLKREVKPCLLMDVFKQSGENSVAVVDGVMKKMTLVNEVVKGKREIQNLFLFMTLPK